VQGNTDQQSHLELEKRVRQILRRFRCSEQDSAGGHDDESNLLPWSERANQIGRGNVRQCPADQSQVSDQDQSTEYRDAREMRRQHDRVDEARFTDGREKGQVLNTLADGHESHAIQVNA
jgi:hypothetical protein